MAVRYISSKLAQQVDEVLMDPGQGAFTLEQLMELAGLACAQALAKAYPDQSKYKKVLVACGPGNQGGDGLVAARHLYHFGYQPSIFYPKEGKKDFYQALKMQCLNHKIPQLTAASPEAFDDALASHDVVLDAIFGFSFSGEVRAPFDTVIAALKENKYKRPIVSVDIPSGWDVDKGNVDGRSFEPEVLVSLTLPKEGAREFKGRHFLGGRFVPPGLAEKFDLKIPPYPGTEQIVDITNASGKL